MTTSTLVILSIISTILLFCYCTHCYDTFHYHWYYTVVFESQKSRLLQGRYRVEVSHVPAGNWAAWLEHPRFAMGIVESMETSAHYSLEFRVYVGAIN